MITNIPSLHPIIFLAVFFASITPAYSATPCHKVLVIGDSITKHGPAQERLGWSGNWGMAASSESKDYVHLFISKLAASQGGTGPELMIAGGGGGKITDKIPEIPKFIAFKADVAIIQLGENDNQNVNIDGFQKPYEQLIEAVLTANPQVRIFCFGVWSPTTGNPTKDAMIKDACKKYKATFVDLSVANANPENKAQSENRFTHPGVNWHPGDKGMTAYADALWQAYTGTPAATSSPAPRIPEKTGNILVETWTPTANPAWSPTPQLEPLGNKNIVRIRNEKVDDQKITINIPAEQIKGRKILITTRIKADSVSEKPNAWNGIKIMLRLQNAEGHLDYPQAKLPVGTFDWQEIKFEQNIPDNIVTATLSLGLEKASGTVWLDSVKITPLP